MNEHNQRNNEFENQKHRNGKNGVSSIKMVTIEVELCFSSFFSFQNETRCSLIVVVIDERRIGDTRKVKQISIFLKNFSEFCPLFTIVIKNSVNSFVVFLFFYFEYSIKVWCHTVPGNNYYHRYMHVMNVFYIRFLEICFKICFFRCSGSFFFFLLPKRTHTHSGQI